MDILVNLLTRKYHGNNISLNNAYLPLQIFLDENFAFYILHHRKDPYLFVKKTVQLFHGQIPANSDGQCTPKITISGNYERSGFSRDIKTTADLSDCRNLRKLDFLLVGITSKR